MKAQYGAKKLGHRATATKTKIVVKAAVLVLLIALIFLLSHHLPQPFSLLESDELVKFGGSKKEIAKFLRSLGPYSPAAFIVLQALQVVVAPIPGELTGIIGGYVYGALAGFLLSTLGLTLGSWIAFDLARILGRPFVAKFVKKEFLEKLDFLTSKAGISVCFALFLFPVFPKDALCYVIGLTGMGLTTFLVISTVGRMPGTYLLTLQGAKIGNQEYYIAAVVMVVSAAAIFIAYLYRAELIHRLKYGRMKILRERL